jgi:hypothetical protein
LTARRASTLPFGALDVGLDVAQPQLIRRVGSRDLVGDAELAEVLLEISYAAFHRKNKAAIARSGCR